MLGLYIAMLEVDIQGKGGFAEVPYWHTTKRKDWEENC